VKPTLTAENSDGKDNDHNDIPLKLQMHLFQEHFIDGDNEFVVASECLLKL
jgi:hypothetical protein